MTFNMDTDDRINNPIGSIEIFFMFVFYVRTKNSENFKLTNRVRDDMNSS